MIKDIVNEVGGEHVAVVGLMKSGVDPHLYKASQGDIQKLEKANIIFYNGLHLEGKMIDIFEKMAKKKKTTIAVSKDISEDQLRGWDDGTEGHDPHIWFNVKHWITATKTVRDELIKYDPDHKEDYQTNADAYIKKLEELDQYAEDKIASIPKQTRVLVTAHDAFGYFGDRYGIEVMGLQGISTASEYGSKDVSELRDFLVANKLKLFLWNQVCLKKLLMPLLKEQKRKDIM